MKVHAKRKAYRAWLKGEAQAGRINDANGRMVARGSAAQNSMARDYSPQGGAK